MATDVAADVGAVVPVVRRLWGALLLIAPRPVLRALAGEHAPDVTRARVVLRVLGARHLVQAVLLARATGSDVRPDARRGAATLGAVVDAVHALTVAGFSMADPRWRRAGLADSAIAATFAVLDVARLRRVAPENVSWSSRSS